MNKPIIIFCKCGCDHGINIDFRFEEVDGDICISTIASCFSARQLAFRKRIGRCLKAAWFMLRGKEYELHDVILNREEWKKFVYAVNTANIVLPKDGENSEQETD